MSASALAPDWLVPEWPAPLTVRALSTLRWGGVSARPYASLNLGDHVGDLTRAVAENRRRLVEAARLPAEPRWLTQVHGTAVADLDAVGDLDAAADLDAVADFEGPGPVAARGSIGPADACFTRRPHRVCAILTADCMPILLAAESGDLVAAVHAGWRGLADGVIETLVGALPAPPAKLMAWLGPAIGPQHFEVGAEVREALLRRDSGAGEAFTANARGRFMADLGQLARRRLETQGVRRIYGSGRCTFAEGDRFFSYRRDGVTGRQATMIWLDSG